MHMRDVQLGRPSSKLRVWVQWTGGRRGFDATPNQRETIREEMMPRTLLTRSLAMIGLAAIVAAPMAWAQDAPPVRVRGTIERVEDPIYVIKARDGAELKLTVAA